MRVLYASKNYLRIAYLIQFLDHLFYSRSYKDNILTTKKVYHSTNTWMPSTYRQLEEIEFGAAYFRLASRQAYFTSCMFLDWIT